MEEEGRKRGNRIKEVEDMGGVGRKRRRKERGRGQWG